MADLHILGISGSLRRGSYNSAALRVAVEVAPQGVSLEVASIADIPLYNGDVEAVGFPEPVQALRSRVAAADALLIATPEYNYSMPGVLKNTIDWLSRPPDQPLNGKPLGLIGASMGQFGTARSQLHLRQSAVYTNMLPLNKPEVLIAVAQNKFDKEGRLTDEPTREFIRQMVAALADWTRRLQAKG